MKRIKEFFLLKDDKFFDLLTNLAECAHSCSLELKLLVDDFEKMDVSQRKDVLKRLYDFEKQGDSFVKSISEALYHNFITPIDREDIHALASTLDTSIDEMEEVGKKIMYYRVDSIPQLMKKQADLVEQQSREIKSAVQKIKSSKSMKDFYQKISDLEDQADHTYELAMSGLFDPNQQLFVSNPLIVIKLKDLYGELEDITDVNQHLAAIIEGIVIKHI
ncbi:MAG: DUF47 family protein [Candidatus Micrarchaeota archaeon]